MNLDNKLLYLYCNNANQLKVIELSSREILIGTWEVMHDNDMEVKLKERDSVSDVAVQQTIRCKTSPTSNAMQVAYFTALFPYVMFGVLFVHEATG